MTYQCLIYLKVRNLSYKNMGLISPSSEWRPTHSTNRRPHLLCRAALILSQIQAKYFIGSHSDSMGLISPSSEWRPTHSANRRPMLLSRAALILSQIQAMYFIDIHSDIMGLISPSSEWMSMKYIA